ncbi:MAG TPA: 16S rRNA (adenine(1518)-N(6)/adenine(1519)-N(6))-dimethyltransferase RsmA [Clostridiaceae bacterium]|nr:16S rRNA (adenine(1518)-N(6)/adenine(1519)-N(6))-dimethyltransferase RsmA [Clostridiaceae bacterium]
MMINTNEVLKKYGLRLTKTLGQNFLTDINIIKKIVAAGEVCPSDLVVEIGPGIGSMTAEIAARAGKVIAVEIDRHLIPALEENLASFPNVEIINGDIMEVDLESLTKGWTGPLKVISNLPYYITTPVVMMLLEGNVAWDTLVLMVQKEVAQRMAAEPSTRDYGALTVAVKYYSEPKLAFTVSRNCFIPKPDVDSAVVKLKKRVLAGSADVDKEFFFKVVRASFGQRRKTLLNSLGSQPFVQGGKERLREALSRLGISENVRAEELSIHDFLNLTKELSRTAE